MTFNVPRGDHRFDPALESSEAGAVQDSSPVTNYLALSVNTVAGKIDLSRQLFDRSNPSVDTVLAQDLAADYAKQLDTPLLTQAPNGVTILSGTNAVTFTTGSPTVAFYNRRSPMPSSWVGVNPPHPGTPL